MEKKSATAGRHGGYRKWTCDEARYDFSVYSQTKPVTGAAAMILMERGKLDLYQPVAEYLPAFREQKIWRNGRCEALLPENGRCWLSIFYG